MKTTSCSREKCDVFICFRGEDTRAGFTSHLRAALKRKVIKTYFDDNLQRGEEISPTILQAIEESTFSVIVFSENFAFSSWCLDELMKIVQCRKDIGQIVIPVFYQVAPSHVRNLTGSFGDAFAEHEQHLTEKMDKVQSWRAALKEAANISGWYSQNSLSESEFVEEIVRDIENQLNSCKKGYETNYQTDTTAAEDFKSDSHLLLKEFYIPNYIIEIGSEIESTPHVPEFPALVFINSKSECQIGANLFKAFCSQLNKNQVFDVEKDTPDKVLPRVYSKLDSLEFNGDKCAAEIHKRLIIIVASDVGTVGRLHAVVSNLKLSHPPRIATISLGAENNISYALGWGNKNPATDSGSVISFLKQVKEAKETKIDNWDILMRMKASEEGCGNVFAPLEQPHPLKLVSTTNRLFMDGHATYHSGIFHYFTIGINAEVKYNISKNQLSNKSISRKLWDSTQRRFPATDLLDPFSRNIAQIATVKIMKRDGKWQKLELPSSIRSIVCLNLPRFPIFWGVDPWGKPNSKKQQDRDLTTPSVLDGLLEIFGFRDAWHELTMITSKGHATRIAQAHGIRFEFHKGGADHTYMMVDGEAWKQPLSVKDDNAVVIEISHLGQVKLIRTD